MKNFDEWHKIKKEIDSKSSHLPFYKERQIRWCRLGVNVGHEQDGTGIEFSRPVLILKGFSPYVCVIVPLTTSVKNNPYHIFVGVVGGEKSYAIISQVRLVDVHRLDTLIETLNREKFDEIKKATRNLFQ